LSKKKRHSEQANHARFLRSLALAQKAWREMMSANPTTDGLLAFLLILAQQAGASTGALLVQEGDLDAAAEAMRVEFDKGFRTVIDALQEPEDGTI
jgi:hypothetical protein